MLKVSVSPTNSERGGRGGGSLLNPPAALVPQSPASQTHSAGRHASLSDTITSMNSSDVVTSPSNAGLPPIKVGSRALKRIRHVAILGNAKGDTFMTATEIEKKEERKEALLKKRAGDEKAKAELDIASSIPAAAAKRDAEQAAKKHPLYFQSVQMVMCPVIAEGATSLPVRDYPYSRSYESILTAAIARETPQMQNKINREEVTVFLKTEECRQMMMSFFWIVLILQRAALPPPASTAAAHPPGMSALLVDDEAESRAREAELKRFYEQREAESVQAKHLYHILAVNYGRAFSTLSSKVTGYEMETKDTVFGLFNALCCHVTYYACTSCFPYDDEAEMFNRRFRKEMLQRLTYWSSGVQMQRVEAGKWPRTDRMTFVPSRDIINHNNNNSSSSSNPPQHHEERQQSTGTTTGNMMENSMSGENYHPERSGSSFRRGSKTPSRNRSASVKRDVSTTLIQLQSFKVRKEEKAQRAKAAAELEAQANNAAVTFTAADLNRDLGRANGRKRNKQVMPTVRANNAGTIWYESGKMLGRLSNERLYEFGMSSGSESLKLEQKESAGTVHRTQNTAEPLPEMVSLRFRRPDLQSMNKSVNVTNTNKAAAEVAAAAAAAQGSGAASKDRREDVFVREIILPGHSPLMHYYTTVVLKMDPEPRATFRKDVKCTVLSELDVSATKLTFATHAKASTALGEAVLAAHKRDEEARIHQESNDQVSLARSLKATERRADYACQMISLAYSPRSLPRVEMEDKTERMLSEALKEAKGDIPQIVADYEEAVLEFRETLTEMSSRRRQELSKMCMQCKVRLLALKRRAPHLFGPGGVASEDPIFVLEATRRMAVPRETDGVLSPEIGRVKYHVDKDFTATLRSKNMPLAKLEAMVVAAHKQEMRSQGLKPFHENKALYGLEPTELLCVLREADPDEEVASHTVMAERVKYYVGKNFLAQLRGGADGSSSSNPIALSTLETLVSADYKCKQRAIALAKETLDSADLFSLHPTRKLNVKRETKLNIDGGSGIVAEADQEEQQQLPLGKIVFYVGRTFMQDLKSKRLGLHKLELEVVNEYKHQKEGQKLNRDLDTMLGRIHEEEKVSPLLSANEYRAAASNLQSKKKRMQKAERKGVFGQLRALSTFGQLGREVAAGGSTRGGKGLGASRLGASRRGVGFGASSRRGSFSRIGGDRNNSSLTVDESDSTGKSYLQLLTAAKAAKEREETKTALSNDMSGIINSTVSHSNKKGGGPAALFGLKQPPANMDAEESDTEDDHYSLESGGESGGEAASPARSLELSLSNLPQLLNLPEIKQKGKRQVVVDASSPLLLPLTTATGRIDHQNQNKSPMATTIDLKAPSALKAPPASNSPPFGRKRLPTAVAVGTTPTSGSVNLVPTSPIGQQRSSNRFRVGGAGGGGNTSPGITSVRTHPPSRESSSFMGLSSKYYLQNVAKEEEAKKEAAGLGTRKNSLSMTSSRTESPAAVETGTRQASTARPPRPPIGPPSGSNSGGPMSQEQLFSAMSARMTKHQKSTTLSPSSSNTGSSSSTPVDGVSVSTPIIRRPSVSTRQTTTAAAIVDTVAPMPRPSDDPMHYPTPPHSRGSDFSGGGGSGTPNHGGAVAGGSRGGDIGESRHMSGIPPAAAGSAGAAIPVLVSDTHCGTGHAPSRGESPASNTNNHDHGDSSGQQRRRYSTKMSSTQLVRATEKKQSTTARGPVVEVEGLEDSQLKKGSC